MDSRFINPRRKRSGLRKRVVEQPVRLSSFELAKAQTLNSGESCATLRGGSVH